MEASEEDMASLLSQFELLHKSYKEAMLDIRTLRAKLSMESQKRESAEALSHSIEQERHRLLRAQGEAFSKAVQQVEFRSQFDDMQNELRSLKLQLASKDREYKEILSSTRGEHAVEKGVLQDQIRQGQEELIGRGAAVSRLEHELSCLRFQLKDVQQTSEKAMHEAILKYQADISDMEHKLELVAQDKSLLEECLSRETNMLKERLHDVEIQLMTERAEFEKRLRESSLSRHSEAHKQKIMRLRKENEELRRGLGGCAGTHNQA